MATGIVKTFNDRRGFGTLFPLGEKRDAELLFFHISQLKGTKSVAIGAEVRFQKIRSEKHAVEAANVESLEFGGQRTLAEGAAQEARERRRRERITSGGKGEQPI